MSETTTATASKSIVGPGNVVHTEWASTDTAATRTFLSDVFDLQFQDMSNPGMEYFTFGDQELGIGGAVRPVVPEEPGPSTTAYLNVADLDATMAKVEGAGGSIMVPKTPVPNMGWFSWFTAPGGLVLAAWQNDGNAPAPES